MKLRERLSGKEASGALTLIFVILFIQTVIFLFNKEEPVISQEPVSVDSKMATPARSEVKPEGITNKERTKRADSKFKEVKRNTPNNEKWGKKEERPPEIKSEVLQELFDFDPNKVTHQELMRLGLTAGQASVVIKFRERGGVFRKNEDLRKIYVLPDGFYERVERYIKIENVPEPVVVELNSADSLTLLSLPGIGPYYASKILDFRKRTGGFAFKSQLMDIKGIDNEKFNILKDRVSADPALIVKRELATTNQNDLSQNPYIGSYLARTIARFVESYKEKPVEVAHLAVNNVINPELLKILIHYFH